MLVKTINAYINSLYKSIERYNDGFDVALPPRQLAVAMENVFHQHGLLVNQSIPLQLSEIEKNKALKNPLRNGVPLPAPTARSDLVWTALCTFQHPQTKKQCSDECYGRLVRTHKWGQKNTRPIQWWGVECTIHRWSNSLGNLFQPLQNLSFTPNEMLSLMTYITTPYKYTGASNCLQHKWASLLHEIVNSLIPQSSSSGNNIDSESITNRTHLTEEDDCTLFTHILPLEYSDMPDLVIKDFGESLAVTPPQQKQHKQRSEGGIGQPPNAPLRKNRSTKISKGRAASAARAVKISSSKLIEDDDEDGQDQEALVPSTTPNKKENNRHLLHHHQHNQPPRRDEECLHLQLRYL